MQTTSKKSDLYQLQPGEIVSRITYLLITEVNPPMNMVTVQDLNNPNTSWKISGKDIIETQMDSSKQYTEEEKLPMTQLAQAFVDVPGDSVFTVHYLKKDKTPRTLVGIRASDSQNILGRSDVIDLEFKAEGKQYYFRQVDHRNILWFICKNKKYVLK